MGLRDHISSDFYIPLVAGVRGASTAPPGVYSPGTAVGSPGDGDGGWDTPNDPDLNTPLITNPDEDEVIDPAVEIATSTAFSAVDAQTHAMSRWWIMLDGGGAILYDSGAQTTNLTSHALADLGLEPGKEYRIAIRHKGSDGGWSAISPWVTFAVIGCDEDTYTYQIDDGGPYETAVEPVYADALDEAIENYRTAINCPVAAFAEKTGYPTLDVNGEPDTTRLTLNDNAITVTNGSVFSDPKPCVKAACLNWITKAILFDGHPRTFVSSTEYPTPSCYFMWAFSAFPVAVGSTEGAATDFDSPILDVATVLLDNPCIELPAPPPPAPPPAQAPVPAPAPPAPQPGVSQIAMDLNQSYVQAPYGGLMTLAEVAAQGGRMAAGWQTYLSLNFANSSGSTAGTLNCRVSVNHTNAVVTPADVVLVSVPAGGSTRLGWVIHLIDQNLGGTYTVSIDTGTGAPYTFDIAFTTLPPPDAP